MNKLRALVLASSALALASGAQAADIVAAPAPSWTGFYVGFGLGAGYAFSDTKAAGGGYYDDYFIGDLPEPQAALDIEDPVYTVNTANVLGAFGCESFFCSGSTGADAGLKDDQGKAGFMGRAEIGADYQFDRIVAGVNASFSLSDRSMSTKAGGSGGGYYYTEGREGMDADGGGYGAVNTSVDVGNSWSIGARLGYLLTDSTLMFASGGYTQEQVKLKSRFQGASGAGIDEYSGIEGSYNISASSDEWLDGYYVGGGLETLLTEHFSLKLEYRYADYGSIKAKKGVSYDGGCEEDACYGYGAGVKAKADISDQTVMATVSFRM